jgi:hypothetical protein
MSCVRQWESSEASKRLRDLQVDRQRCTKAPVCRQLVLEGASPCQKLTTLKRPQAANQNGLGPVKVIPALQVSCIRKPNHSLKNNGCRPYTFYPLRPFETLSALGALLCGPYTLSLSLHSRHSRRLWPLEAVSSLVSGSRVTTVHCRFRPLVPSYSYLSCDHFYQTPRVNILEHTGKSKS